MKPLKKIEGRVSGGCGPGLETLHARLSLIGCSRLHWIIAYVCQTSSVMRDQSDLFSLLPAKDSLSEQVEMARLVNKKEWMD